MKIRENPSELSVLSNKHSILAFLIVLIGPLAQMVLFGSRLVQWVPVWTWYTDPGYQYLFNGAVIITGGTPGHTDHPGTSIQWLIGIIEIVTYWLGGSSENIFSDIVNRPEYYSQIVSASLLFLYLVALVLLAYRMWKFFGTVAALVTQLLILWAVTLLGSGVFKLVPETLVVICFVSLLATLTPSVRFPRMQLNAWVPPLVGMICAVGITSKIIFIPALILPLLLLKARQAMIVILVFLASTALIMIPTYSRFEQMWNWYSGVLLNSGRHGGEVEKTNFESLIDAIIGISGAVRWWPFIVVLLLILTIFLIVFTRARIAWKSGTLSLISLLVFNLGVLGMGYKQSETRDFLLLSVSVSVWAGLVVFAYRNFLGEVPARLVGVLSVLFASFLAAHGLVGNVYSYPLVTDRSNERIESALAMSALADSGIVAQGYGSWTEASSLSFAEYWTNGEFAQYLASRYPQTFEYSIWDQRIYSWDEGNGRQALTCSQILDILDRSDMYIVVPGIGTIAVDENRTSVSSPDGEILVQEIDAIGPNFVFRITGMKCADSTNLPGES